MSVIKKMRRQTAVVWRRLKPDRHGKFAYGAPFQLACRWDSGINEYRNEKGEVAFATSIMYPDQVLAIGDRAMEGELDSNVPADPTTAANVFEIKMFEQTPNFRATEKLFTAYLS